jgi:hypothetical protein
MGDHWAEGKMRGHLASRAALAIAIGLTAGLSACGGHLPPRASPSPGPTARPGASIAPLEIAFSGALPASAEFLGLHVTVSAAKISNLHPYPMFKPKPGRDLFGILSVSVENRAASEVDYAFDEAAFTLETWSGQVLTEIEPPGARGFSDLAPGARSDATIAFGLPDSRSLEGAILRIGTPPDRQAEIGLSTPAPASPYPARLPATPSLPVSVGSIQWALLSGQLSLDAPAGVCCP